MSSIGIPSWTEATRNCAAAHAVSNLVAPGLPRATTARKERRTLAASRRMPRSCRTPDPRSTQAEPGLHSAPRPAACRCARNASTRSSADSSSVRRDRGCLGISPTADRAPNLHRGRLAVKLQVIPSQRPQLLGPRSSEQRDDHVGVHRRSLRGRQMTACAWSRVSDFDGRPTTPCGDSQSSATFRRTKSALAHAGSTAARSKAADAPCQSIRKSRLRSKPRVDLLSRQLDQTPSTKRRNQVPRHSAAGLPLAPR